MTSSDRMSPDYRSMLVQLMESQAYRELAAAHLFGYGLRERHHCRLRPRIDGLPHFPDPTSV